MLRLLPLRALPALLLLVTVAAAPCAWPLAAQEGSRGSAPSPDRVYHVYVGAESADLMHRIRFGPDGAAVATTTPVGEMSVETEGPHGFSTSPDGRFIYMTTGHGVPDGKLWKYDAGADTLVAEPILLGRFPATLDLTPDGLYAFVVNFNLHGEHVPSTVSVVYTPDMVEVEQIETCVMPHGLRASPDGLFVYSNCMMDDQMVEIDTRTFEVSRRFSVAKGREGPLPATAEGTGHGPMQGGEGAGEHEEASPGGMDRSCSPTWAEPSPDGRSVFVACNMGDWILEMGREDGDLLRTIRTSRPGPYNLELSPDGRLLIATLKSSDAIELFDVERGRSLGVVESSTTIPHGVVISPDARYAFVSVEGVGAEPGKVDILSLEPFERVASVEVGQQAGGITFWKMEPASGTSR